MARDVGSALVGPDHAEPDRWPLVGRSNEITQLKASISGRRGAVIIGPAGRGQDGPGHGRHRVRPRPRHVGGAGGGNRGRPALCRSEPSPRSSTATRTSSVRNRTPISCVATCTSCSTTPGSDRSSSFVDDAHLLDDGSASLVHQLAQAGAATVLACVLSSGRAGQPGGRSHGRLVEGLRRGPHRTESARRARRSRTCCWRCWAGPSTPCHCASSPSARSAIPSSSTSWSSGRCEHGSLREENGIWRLRGALLPTARLVDLVTARLGALTDRSATRWS